MEMWVQANDDIFRYARCAGFSQVIEAAGAQFVKNACPGAMPKSFFEARGFRAVATDSPKMAYYISTTKHLPCCYGSLDWIVNVMTEES